MESWFLTDMETLESFYGQGFRAQAFHMREVYRNAHPKLHARSGFLASPLNWRYTLVLKPEPGEWPAPIVSVTSPMESEAKREERNRRRRERQQQAKERGLCTKCYQEPAKPDKSVGE